MLRILSNIKSVLIFSLYFCLQYSCVLAADIFVVQSAKIPVYNAALNGLESVILRDIPSRGRKSIQPHTITTFSLSEESRPQGLKMKIIRQNPDAIIAIGSSSLSLVRSITEIPIIYILVPEPEQLVETQDNVTGVRMNLSAGQQLAPLIRLIPEVKSIGLLYDPGNTGDLVNEAEEFARQRNIDFVARSVKTSKEVAAKLAGLKDRIDAFWMVPDRTVITSETLEQIFLFSLENRIPVLTFAEKYLKLGAVLSVSFDSESAGIQAGELTLAILKNNLASFPPPAPARGVNIRVNSSAAETLGIKIAK